MQQKETKMLYLTYLMGRVTILDHLKCKMGLNHLIPFCSIHLCVQLEPLDPVESLVLQITLGLHVCPLLPLCECFQSLIAKSFYFVSFFCPRPPSVHQTSGQETWPAAGCRPCSFSPYGKLAEEKFHDSTGRRPHFSLCSLLALKVRGSRGRSRFTCRELPSCSGGDEGGWGGGCGGISVGVKGLSVLHPLTPH